MKDQELISAIKKGSDSRLKALEYLYLDQTFQKRVESLVHFYKGAKEDIEAIRSESIIILDRNIRNGRFKEDSSLKTYLMSIAKHYYFAKQRKNKISVLGLENITVEPVSMQNPELMCINQETETLLNRVLGQLGDKCRKVLSYWSLSYTYKEIAHLMDFENAGNVRKRKFDCIKRLENYILENPNLIERFTIKT